LWVVRTAVPLSLLALAHLLYKGAPEELAFFAMQLALFAITFAGILLGLFTKGRGRALAWAFGAGTVMFVGSLRILVAAVAEADRALIARCGLLAMTQAALAASALKAFYAVGREKRDLRKLVEGILGPMVLLGIVILLTPNFCTLTPERGNEVAAMGFLRTVNTAEITYAETYKTGFSRSLAALAPPPAGAQLSASAAGLLLSDLANGVRSGYRFIYTPGPPDKASHIQTFTLTARPLEYGKSGRENFFTDQSGVIRETNEDRPASVKDPPIGG
jgi:hypothetical protein